MTRSLLLVLGLTFSSTAFAGSVCSYGGCKNLKGSRSACEQCVGGGNCWQPSSNQCGMAEGMHKSVATPQVKPPPRPTAMPKSGTQYVTIKPGSFAVGSRSIDQYKDDMKDVFGVTVTLTHTIQMKATEVTQAEWYFITGSITPSYDKACGLDCPVGSTSWNSILTYLNMLSKKEGLEPCYVVKKDSASWPKGYECTGYRLPTDAEWEYAARAGTEEERYGEIDEIAWYYDNAKGSAHPVGKKKPNAWGLYDMLGNSWEWVWDAEDNKPYPDDVTDPIIGGNEQPSEKQDRVMRGASYRDHPYDVRAPERYQYLAHSGSAEHGFRPVRTVPAK